MHSTSLDPDPVLPFNDTMIVAGYTVSSLKINRKLYLAELIFPRDFQPAGQSVVWRIQPTSVTGVTMEASVLKLCNAPEEKLVEEVRLTKAMCYPPKARVQLLKMSLSGEAVSFPESAAVPDRIYAWYNQLLEEGSCLLIKMPYCGQDYCIRSNLMPLISRSHYGRPVPPELRKGFSQNQVWRWISKLVIELMYLHRRVAVIYCDMKPGNTFSDATEFPVLGDFGLIRQAPEGYFLLEAGEFLPGSLCYYPPESYPPHPDEHYISVFSDMWSAGVLLFCLFFRRAFEDAFKCAGGHNAARRNKALFVQQFRGAILKKFSLSRRPLTLFQLSNRALRHIFGRNPRAFRQLIDLLGGLLKIKAADRFSPVAVLGFISSFRPSVSSLIDDMIARRFAQVSDSGESVTQSVEEIMADCGGFYEGVRGVIRGSAGYASVGVEEKEEESESEFSDADSEYSQSVDFYSSDDTGSERTQVSTDNDTARSTPLPSVPTSTSEQGDVKVPVAMQRFMEREPELPGALAQPDRLPIRRVGELPIRINPENDPFVRAPRAKPVSRQYCGITFPANSRFRSGPKCLIAIGVGMMPLLGLGTYAAAVDSPVQPVGRLMGGIEDVGIARLPAAAILTALLAGAWVCICFLMCATYWIPCRPTSQSSRAARADTWRTARAIGPGLGSSDQATAGFDALPEEN